ncbi:hypothetical protein GCM10023085_63880 [Actinomadura viridis]|uniref:UBP-type domain-containing protein n=1 Tax=Actinomadura viridis TaxID=58110 RepID=A0A931DSL9_9ACTN|nr:UBP-type zinc finger domain-containing protein [Actinomadura viridis]MBG6093192.1 hypothetical protein [Actinomadura viridis]
MGAGRKRTDQNMCLNMPPISPNGSAPHYEHLDGLVPVTSRSNECPECQARGDIWTDSRVCWTRGWMACSDDSPDQRARAHYRETDPPLVAGVETGSRWRWCCVRQRLV